MSDSNNFNATAIVRTNLLRQTMNIRKAQTNTFKYNISLTNCAAIDSCSTKTLTQRQQEYLLHLDLTSSKIKDALPGFLPLYVGMFCYQQMTICLPFFFSSLWTKFCSTTTDNPPPKTASTQDWIDLIFKGKEKKDLILQHHVVLIARPLPLVTHQISILIMHLLFLRLRLLCIPFLYTPQASNYT